MTSSSVTGLWKKISNKFSKPNNTSSAATIIQRDDHCVSRKHISDAALKVIRRLNDEGFDAYLVGGGVRDLLLGGHPKDFDIATNATPEQVRGAFRNSRIIGRRFRIVHVRFGKEVIEVTTFRGSHDAPSTSTQRNKNSARTESGMLTRDNVYGSIDEDAARRDLSINALYYSSRDFCVHDYVGGMHDLEQKLIRIIGDPETRYREDPVRMLRVVRFAAKLNFDIEQHTEEPLKRLAPLLTDISAARMFDEVIKLLMSGQGLQTYALMQRYDLFRPLFPATHKMLNQTASAAEELIQQGLINTDARIAEGKPVTPAFIYAVLLWPVVKKTHKEIIDSGVPEIPALHQAAERVLHKQQQTVAIPKRFSLPMRDIWELQSRLTRRSGKRAELLLGHRYFRAGFDFLLLREQAGEIEAGLGQWWLAFQEAHSDTRGAMLTQVPAGDKARPTRRRRGPRKAR
ncbi:Poly(A) polymerase I [Zhongshania aliphaticivorans]|uniref:Poly(A) polymerase I n=1 Tax=Zhongshania aliphaticivorans TaxID=1470434 RepID=A0A5S9QTY3_9GAMM|nr:polynucleotide adenylyltransferase PcnB [Zhongshania aliphaticivorans]CAA0114799.1 Poly(A) polymerase I [Zhongshania aliphaticivorans]CAA0123027.1 Poly(A) polymerase I [Zhongshania aliphaticivorans]